MSPLPKKSDIDKQKLLIGEFFVYFERINASIRFIILQIIYPEYNDRQYTNIEILLEGLTADPLRRKLNALINNNYA